MPHALPRLAGFFRSRTNSFNLPTDPAAKEEATASTASRRSSSTKPRPRPKVSDRSPSSSGSSLASEDKSARMPDVHKRLSLGGLHSPKSSASKLQHHQSANLDIVIESPPLLFYGPESSSTGALLSGQLTLNVHEESMTIESFKMRLALEVTRKKPFHAHCQECAHQSSDLETWAFIQGPTILHRGKETSAFKAPSTWTNSFAGEHNYPFSFLLPGHLPATMKAALSSIDYVLRATIQPKTGDPIKLSRNLDLKRAICPPDVPRQSIRIFPPTNLTANCQLPPVIHPIGEATVSMRMDGIVKRNAETKTQNQWKLKRMTWRLDETQKEISPACAKHAAKLGHVEEAKKGMPHQDVRTIGTDEMKTGWKSDYSSADGTIELEFPISIRPDSKAVCDMKAEDGTEVSHVLVVEMIVAEEFAPIKKPNQITPTGAARVLRMHFNITLTERAGLGISWDEEQPPLYENVPASPPAYGINLAYEGEPIPDYEDLSPLEAAVDTLTPGQNPALRPLDSRDGTPSRPSTEHTSSRQVTLEDLHL